MSDDYVISTNKTRLDVAVIHDFLSNRSYWGKGRTIEAVRKTIDHSLCFGAYNKDNRLVGFARVVSDLTIFAYLMDVFVLEEHRGRGLGKQLVDHIVNYPAFQDIRFWRLDTDDAHELYRKYGFKEPAFPEKIMKKRNTANEAVQRIGHKAASR
ncbi:MAG: GNAT family N-acetyltransferase [Syntrophales bacterium]|nr:GNAT family N-acetyltransferase [Syntrophales bacterium]